MSESVTRRAPRAFLSVEGPHMIRITAACLACLGILLSTCLPVRGAAPPAVSVLSNIDFLGPTQGWIEVSSSPYYTQSCQTELHPPAVCNRAVTDLFQTTNGGRTWTRRLRLAGRPLTPSG